MKKLIQNVVVVAFLLLGGIAIAAQQDNEVENLLQDQEKKEQVYKAIVNSPELKREMMQRLGVDGDNKSCCAMMGNMNDGEMKGMMDMSNEDGEMCKMCKMMMGDGKMGMMKNMKHGDMGMMNMEKTTPADLQGEPTFLVNYNDLKNALVKDSAAEAKEAASQMLKNISVIEIAENPHTQLVQNLKEIANSEDLKVQRKQFAQLSEALYQVVKNNDLTEEVLYLQYCPMAMGGKGANWLSYEKQVQNPYMGQRMPNCGSVKEVVE